jgi:hypothetical protein
MHPRNARYCTLCGNEWAEGHDCRETVREAKRRVKQEELGNEPERTFGDRLQEAEAMMGSLERN